MAAREDITMVHPLTRLQIFSIVKEANPKLVLVDEELDALCHDLNWTLSQMGFYVNIELEAAQAAKMVKALRRVLFKLKVEYQPAIPLLKSLAFHHCIIKNPERISPSVCSRTAIDHVESLFGEADRMLQHLTGTSSKDISALIPHLKTDDLIRSRLPTIFSAFFGRPCGISHHGPGTRFIKAVLREAGIRTQRGTSFGPDAIVKCRSRGSRNGLPLYSEIRNPWLTTMDRSLI